MIIAGVAQQGLWVHEPDSSSWTRLGQGPGSAQINNRPSAIVYDPVEPNTFWESGIYGGGVYKTTDNGMTFTQLGNIGHSDGVAVDFTDPARNTLLSGTHEQAMPFLSTDGGGTWTNIAASLPSDPGSVSSVLILDGQVHLLGSQKQGTGAGLFRTTNAGATWSRVYSEGVWGQPLVAQSDQAIYFLLQNGAGLIRSTDRGLTWRKVGTQATFAASSGSSLSIIELPDGRLAAVGSDHIIISKDHAATWNPVGPTLPYAPWGLVYTPFRNAFYIWHWDCGGTVLPDAVMRLDFNYRNS